ncbi:MAG: hypothetical protein ACJAXQ_001269 [Parvibaculaceae bacterium]|jgi:hypothetical protein
MAKQAAKKPSIGRILVTNDDGIHAPGLKTFGWLPLSRNRAARGAL